LDRPIDRTGTEACAKKTLGPVVRTGVLLMGAVLASILAVDLPVPASDRSAQPYVPASDRWIELGANKVTDPPGLMSEFRQRS